MRRKTRVLTPVFRQLSFSQLLSTVCRILPHCAHAAGMNFFLSILGYSSEPASKDISSGQYLNFCYQPDFQDFSGMPIYLFSF
uniref:Uncharacterized protein n=1 Tax=Siphoviridae sp. ctTBd21 TaxID=2825516 RepID=A0A8S5Q8I1_9CAUD|nr:MAG TPA: hypothetical protein [Siphoviridae sp. ctTBd21]